MTELFRFTSIRKFDDLHEPCGKINVDDVLGHWYTEAKNTKTEEDLKIVQDRFLQTEINKNPLLINTHVTSIYKGIQERKKYSKEDLEKLCDESFGSNIATFVKDSQFKAAKAIIVKNLYFLTLINKKKYSNIKIFYKHLLKIVGLLEAIANDSSCLEKILFNPSLQYYIFEFPVVSAKNDEKDGKKKNEKVNDKLKDYKENLLKEYDYILALKNTQEELYKLHKHLKGKDKFKQLSQEIADRVTDNASKRLSTSTSKQIDPLDEPDPPDLSDLLFATSKDLTPKSREILSGLGIDHSNFEPISVINNVYYEYISKSNRLNNSLHRPGSVMYQGKRIYTGQRHILSGIDFSQESRALYQQRVNEVGSTNDSPPSTPAAPTTHGAAKILGEGALYKVEEEYLGCKLGNVSSIVNIPAHVEKEYKNRYLTRTVATSESETSSSTTDETSVESREQNNTSSETEKVLQFDMSLQAGASVSASYGGTVGIEASSNFSTSVSSSETTNSAASYAKDVTLRAVKKIEQRVRELQRTERTTENELTNTESFKNQTAEHTVGIYQWVNEVYKSRLVQYDSRLLLEFMVPEPGSMLLYASRVPAPSQTADAPKPPDDFDIEITDITPNKYMEKAILWGAADVNPPPAPVIIVTKKLDGPNITSADNPGKPFHINLSDDTLTIPEGYNVDYIKARLSANRFFEKDDENYNDKEHRLLVTIGYQFFVMSNNKRQEGFTLDLSSEVHWNNIPISVTGFQKRTYVLHIAAYCVANHQAMEKWQMETYAKLKQAHQKQLDDYNDQLALSRQRSFLSGKFGTNPDKNRATERDELKRACISILTGQSFDLFDSIQDFEDGGIPTISFDQLKPEGDYIRFFETAFEWTQLTYVLYPYFWANPQQTWLRSLNLGLDDPKHEEFLKSGYARVVVPVRPEFNSAITKYLEDGTLWDGRNPDDIDLNDPMYIKIVTEIMERQGHLAKEPELIDEWEYSIPTNLQILTNGTILPKPPFIQ